MVSTQIETKIANEWLKLAQKRIKIPSGAIAVNYQKDADLLVIRFSDKKSVKGRMDYDKDVVINYDDNGDIVSIEVLDLYGVFVETL